MIRATQAGTNPRFEGVEQALASDPRVHVRLFGKPDTRVGRRMGVAVCHAEDPKQARALAATAAEHVRVIVDV